MDQLNEEDTARLEQSRKNYDELERAVANEGLLDQKQTITLEDGPKLKASDALKQVSLSKNEGVKRVLKTQKQVDKLEKGKIQSLDSDTLEHLRTTEKGRNIEATIVRNNPEIPAFRSRRTGRKGTLMAKEEAKLMDAMRQNIVDLTALQDVQKIKAAASLTEWRALDKVRKKYASQLKTVKKFQKMAGSPEAYDEMRAEVGAVPRPQGRVLLRVPVGGRLDALPVPDTSPCRGQRREHRPAQDSGTRREALRRSDVGSRRRHVRAFSGANGVIRGRGGIFGVAARRSPKPLGDRTPCSSAGSEGIGERHRTSHR